MKKLAVFVMLAAMTFFWMPADNSVSAQQGQMKSKNKGRSGGLWSAQGYRDKHKGTWRKKNSYGYRNYGQYRRTQVGNRRYRTVNRTYWVDGIRRVRQVRRYY